MWLIRIPKFVDNILYDNSITEEYYLKMRQKSSSTSAFVVGLVAAVGGFLYGYDTGLINDILEMSYVENNFPANGHNFTSHERAFITAILSLGTFCGALVAPLVSDRYGRKSSIVVSSGILFNIGNVLQVASTGNVLLCLGRFISGVSVGILSAIVPLYQAEASPKWVRGSVVYLYQWAITWGLLVASAVCQGTRRIPASASYRIPIGLQFLWALPLYTGMLFLPESPRFYVQKDKLEKALESLSKLRRIDAKDPDLIEELVEIKASYDYEMSFGKTSLLDCFRNGGGRNKQVLRMLTGMGVHLFQQCSGINFIFYYGVNFFSSTGVQTPYLMSFITYTVNTVFTIPGILLIEIIGRRKLLLWGGLGMTVSNLIIGIIGVSVPNGQTNSKVSIAFSCLFIAFFAASWGGCCWALTSDLYGISIRQKAISMTVATNWLVNFVFAFITPYLIDTGHHTAALGHKIFFIWGGCNALGTLFVYFVVYETKGLRLEEVDYMYKVCNNPFESTKFKSTKISYGTGVATPVLKSKSSSSENADDEKKDSSPDQDRNDHNDTPHDSDSDGAHHNPMGITIVPYNNVLSPSISGASGSSDSMQNGTSDYGTSDYQRYLDSIQAESQTNKYDSSQTLASTVDKAYIMKDLGPELPVAGTTNQNMTIIAAPFFSSPPSDSDSDDEGDDEN